MSSPNLPQPDPNAPNAQVEVSARFALDFDALRYTIYGEARGEGIAGMIAVGWVIINRVLHPTIHWWGTTIEEVCHKPAQFSCWNRTDPNFSRIKAVSEDDPSLLLASGVAGMLMIAAHRLPDPTRGATSYCTTDPPAKGMHWPPQWTEKMRRTVVILHHTFYEV